MDLFTNNTKTATTSKTTNPTRLTIGNVSVQATKEGTNFGCLTLIVKRKLTINKPLKGIVDLINAGIFTDDIKDEAKQAINSFYAKNKDKLSVM